MAEKKRRALDVHTKTSRKKGVAGIFERFLRKFRTLGFVIFLSPLIALSAMTLAIAAMPGIWVFHLLSAATEQSGAILHYFAIGCGLSFGYLCYGLTLIFLVPAINFVLPLRLRAWRGIWFSIQAIPWYVHNALTYLVRYTFLDFVTPSPLNNLFYKMMGMKIGKGVLINTTNISDPCLIELGDFVTIGGSAHLMAHYGQKGYLILAPVKIGEGTTIGLKASVMGGADIGKHCTVKPHAAVLPKTKIEDGQVF